MDTVSNDPSTTGRNFDEETLPWNCRNRRAEFLRRIALVPSHDRGIFRLDPDVPAQGSHNQCRLDKSSRLRVHGCYDMQERQLGCGTGIASRNDEGRLQPRYPAEGHADLDLRVACKVRLERRTS